MIWSQSDSKPPLEYRSTPAMQSLTRKADLTSVGPQFSTQSMIWCQTDSKPQLEYISTSDSPSRTRSYSYNHSIVWERQISHPLACRGAYPISDLIPDWLSTIIGIQICLYIFHLNSCPPRCMNYWCFPWNKSHHIIFTFFTSFLSQKGGENSFTFFTPFFAEK
jgi:hypothetical protein